VEKSYDAIDLLNNLRAVPAIVDHLGNLGDTPYRHIDNFTSLDIGLSVLVNMIVCVFDHIPYTIGYMVFEVKCVCIILCTIYISYRIQAMDNLPSLTHTPDTAVFGPEKIEPVKEDAKPTEPEVMDSGALTSEIEKHQKVIDETTLKVNEVRASLGLSSAEADIPSIASHRTNVSELEKQKDEVATSPEDWRHSALERFGIDDFNVEEFRRKKIELNITTVKAAIHYGKDWNYILDEKNGITSSTETHEAAIQAFKTMEELEEMAPGSVKSLHENFGITNFQRYPLHLLIQQLETPDPNKETGVMVFASEDWCGSFDSPEHRDLVSKLYENRHNKSNFRIIECKSKIDLARQLIKVKHDFTRPISFALISAHGENNAFYLGPEEGSGQEFVDKEDMEAHAPGMFAPDAQIIADSCSSGSINGWVQTLSKNARVHATGPDRAAFITDFEFIGDQIIPHYSDNGDPKANIASHHYNGFLLTKK
jgi:hypothetical protein